MTAVLLTGVTVMIATAAKKEVLGSYKNETYELTGLKNPDGTIVRGINYTPLYNYGWFVGVMTESHYRPNVIREELALVALLGFNSVRLMSPFGSWNNNPTAAEPILKNYDDFFLACRENGLTVSLVLPRYPEEDYKAEDSFTRWLLTEMVNRFDKKYADVIVQYEVSNEPDLNIFNFDVEWGKNQYLTNSDWNNSMKPCLQFSRDLLKELGVTKPISVGAMTTSLFTPWDAENFDVINLHPYLNTVENTDVGFTSVAAKMDMETLGYVRPVVYTEIAWISGNHSRASDIMQYCHENDLAYYVWGFAANSFEQGMQGIMDVDKVLRVGTLPYSLLQNYSRWWPVAAVSYDDTPTGGGANILGSVRSAIEYKKIGGTELVNYMAKGAQAAHSQMGALAGYWTPDFRELFLTSTGNTVAEKAETAMRNSVLSILPYIRTYGTYENDNALGGTLKANYFENMYKYNTSRGQSIWRARFTMDKGKDGSKGIFMEYASNLVLRQPLDSAKTYTVSIDLNPSIDSYNGIAFACGDDDDNTYNVLNPGIYFRVSHKESADSAAIQSSPAQPANTIQIYTVDQAKKQTWRSVIALKEEYFDEDGYISLTIEFAGNGTREYPFKATVYSGETKLGTVNVKASAMASDCGNLMLFGAETGVNYFDNLILSDENGTVLLSDSFESGKHDYEFLTYTFGGAKGDWSNEITTGDMTNPKYYDEMESLAKRLLGSAFSYKVPENFASYVCDGLLVCEWDYNGVGESGFEIQRSKDGSKWESYWRSMAGTRAAIIPLFTDDADQYQYRISPVTSKNETEKFTDPVKASLGKGAEGNYLASYTDKNGKIQTVEVVGNGVFRTCDIKEIAEEDNNNWIDRYVKRTTYNENITNVKPTSSGDNGEGSDTDDNKPQGGKKIGSEKLLLAAAGAVIVAAIAGIAAFAVKIFRKDGNKK